MKRPSMVVIAVVAAVALAGSGLYVAYALSAPSGSPCASIVSSSSASTSSTSALAAASLAGPSESIGAPAVSGPATPPLSAPPPVASANDSTEVIPVVAAENFWGSLVSQLGGSHVSVTSIVSDPNTDPHEYQANESDAIAITNAQYVILNNVGYDDWATGIVQADGDTNQTVLNIGDYLGVSVDGGIVTGNPHLWYNPTYVREAIAWMYDNLTTIAPGLTGYFTNQYNNLTASLNSTYAWVTQIKEAFAGTEVASTESIFVYLANATGLDLVSPPAFMEAIAEGNDPPDSSVVQFQCQLQSGSVHVLVYNAQTVTPITSQMKSIAQESNVTVISVTETIQPPTASFQLWMTGQLLSLYNALNANALGQ